MSKIIFVIDFADARLATLHKILGFRDMGMHVELVGIEDIKAVGKKPNFVVYDDIVDTAWLKAALLKQAEDIKPITAMDHQRNRGRASKGDRHKNKRFRWS